MGNPDQQRSLIYLCSTQKDLYRLPEDVQRVFVVALRRALVGDEHREAKSMRGFCGRSVMEMTANHRNSTYRLIYTTRFKKAIYVLHVFQKKSKTGIRTPREDIELIKNRLKLAEKNH